MTCLKCQRPMREQRVRIADAPGTVLHKGRGLCWTCFQHRHDRGWEPGKNQGGPTGVTRAKSKARVENIIELQAQGYDMVAIAARLGLTVMALKQFMYRHREALSERTDPPEAEPESPDVLDGGRWVRRGVTWVWVEDQEDVA